MRAGIAGRPKGLMQGVIKLSSPATKEFWEIPVLHEDAQLLAISKPSHLLTSPDRYDPDRPNLMNLLHRDIERGAPWARERGVQYLSHAHRLDFDTSGVLLLAKDRGALVKLADLFGAEKPVQLYVALVHGNPPHDTFEVDLKLAPHPLKPGMIRSDPHGKKSRTRFEVIERFSRFTLLKCQPLTARKHQMRVHLRARRLPLVGDTLYGGRSLLLSRLKPDYRFKGNEPEKPLMARSALHAEKLEIPHPVTGELVRIEAPWPKDFTVAVKYLRRYAPVGGRPPETTND